MWRLRTVFCEREESVACDALLSLQVRLAELNLWAHDFSAEGARAHAGYAMSPAGSALAALRLIILIGRWQHTTDHARLARNGDPRDLADAYPDQPWRTRPTTARLARIGDPEFGTIVPPIGGFSACQR